MIVWNIYVLVKLAIQCLGFMRVDPVPELACLAFVYAVSRYRAPNRRVAVYIGLAATALAGVLAWHETFLPPLSECAQFVLIPGQRPDRTYFMSFLEGFFKPWQLAAGAAGLAAAGFAGSRIKGRRLVDITPAVAALVILFAVLWPMPDQKRLTKQKDDFFAAEAGRRVALPKPATDFDIIIIHVCSLSWEDLWSVNYQDNPVLSEFDVLFSSFNTVSSYSEQAGVRLLRAPCGQGRWDDLYTTVAPDCYLHDALKTAGYSLDNAENHGGEYLDWDRKLRLWAHMPPPMDVSDMFASKVNFNGTAIYKDYDVLERWWKARQRGGARRAAVYYNTVSLHTGAIPLGQPQAWRRGIISAYTANADLLFADLRRFFRLVESSGRDAVVLFVPEHGAAVTGSQFLIPGMRDLPLAGITLVPVGVKLIGPHRGRKEAAPRWVAAPSSYLALAELLARFMARPPFGPHPAPLDAALAGLPETRYVAENHRMVLMPDASDMHLCWLDGKWVTLPRKFHPGRVHTR